MNARNISLFSILIMLAVAPAARAQTFSDVPVDYWAYSYIEELASRGITAGCGGGNFCPEGTVTRAQMAVFLIRLVSEVQHQSDISVPGVAFRPISWPVEVRYRPDGSIASSVPGSIINAYAPLQLPDRMRITQLRCWLRDPDESSYAGVVLRRLELLDTDDGVGEPRVEDILTLYSNNASVTAGYDEFSASVDPNMSWVDNANFTYFMRVNLFTPSDTSSTSGVALRGCSIALED